MYLSKEDYDLIIDSLRLEVRTLNGIMRDLETRGLHTGNQNVAIAMRVHKLSELIRDIESNRPA